jgi:hypothetical protein
MCETRRCLCWLSATRRAGSLWLLSLIDIRTRTQPPYCCNLPSMALDSEGGSA